MENEYTNREIDHFMNDIHSKLDLILVQTTKHNGRMTAIERRQDNRDKILLVVGAISGTILLMNGSELVSFFKILI